MPIVSSLVDFLMRLLGDDQLRAEFQADPERVLAEQGLGDICAQDVADAAPLVADRAEVQPVAADSAQPVAADPVAQINHVTDSYRIDEQPEQPDHYNVYHVDDRDTIVNVDDRDTTNIQAGGDVTIEDSFNQDNDVNVIEDSFNQDNDGLDNKGGSIDDSVAAGDDVEESANSDTDTVDGSFNSDDDGVDLDVSPSGVSLESGDTSLGVSEEDAGADDAEPAADPVGV